MRVTAESSLKGQICEIFHIPAAMAQFLRNKINAQLADIFADRDAISSMKFSGDL